MARLKHKRVGNLNKNWVVFIEALDPGIDPVTVRLMDDLRQVSHALRLIGEESLASTGLSWAKFRLLSDLLYHEIMEGRTDLNPSEISERQGTSRNTISSLIGDLEAESLIERRLDAKDRRKFKIRLTDAGRDKVRDHASNHFRIITDCFNVLDPTEQAILGQLLAKISKNVAE